MLGNLSGGQTREFPGSPDSRKTRTNQVDTDSIRLMTVARLQQGLRPSTTALGEGRTGRRDAQENGADLRAFPKYEEEDERLKKTKYRSNDGQERVKMITTGKSGKGHALSRKQVEGKNSPSRAMKRVLNTQSPTTG